MKTQYLSFFFFATLFGISSCDKEELRLCRDKDDKPSTSNPILENCVSFHELPIKDVNVPTTAPINEQIAIPVSFWLSNGCGKLDSLIEKKEGNLITIQLKGKYEGCVCTEAIRDEQTFYKFRATTAGTYQLRFLQSDNTYLNQTIEVE
jgi:hypothetical protein